MIYQVFTGRWQDHLADIPEHVDHLITDPPYSAHTHSKSRAGARKTPLHGGNGHVARCAISREVEFGFDPITQDGREAVGDLCSGRVCRWSLVFCDVESTALWIGALTSAGRTDYCRTCAWVKLGATPQFTGDRPGVGFEAIVACHRVGRKRWNGGGKAGVYHELTCIERGGQRHANNRRCHPTQKPLSLMLALVADFTSPGDLVLDLYAGSGTTGVACARLGRQFIGFEQKPEWAEMARERIAAELASSTPEAAKAGQMPMFSPPATSRLVESGAGDNAGVDERRPPQA